MYEYSGNVLGSANALVVDDCDIMRSVLVELLSQAGIPSFEAANGSEALAIISRHKVGLVCTDIRMPVMDGNDFIKHVRQDKGCDEIPILIVSSEPRETVIGATFPNVGFVKKSDVSVDFMDTVRQATAADDLRRVPAWSHAKPYGSLCR